MDQDLYDLMQQWLKDPKVSRKKHAEYRLSLPDAVSFKRILETKLPSESPTYPSWMTMAGNLAGSVERSVSAVIHGKQIIRTNQEQEACMAICKTCDRYDPKQSRCTICGCKMRLKTRLATDHCPLDPPKW